MAVTKFGIVYATASAQIRRYIYPTLSDSEISNHPLQPGESLTTCNIGPYASSAAWQTAITNAVTAAAGKAPGDPRCCVIDGSGKVVEVIMADPAIDTVSGMTLVNSSVANVGWTWTAGGGFVSPPPQPGKTG